MNDNKELVNSIIPGSEAAKPDISVTVKRNAGENDEIDLVRVFKYMGKKSGIFVTLILLLAAIGVSVALFMAENQRNSSDAVASIQVLMDKNYNVDTLASAYVVKNALIQAGLSDKLSVDSVRNNIEVSRVLKEEYRQKLAMYSKLNLSADSIRELLGTEPEYEDIYIVTLRNGFGEKQKMLKDNEMTALLNAIITRFNDSFYEEYSNITAPEYGIGGFSYESVEYSEAADVLRQAFIALSNYCNNISDAFPTFSRDGLTYKDMAELITLSYEAQVNYFGAYIFYSNTVRDKESFSTLYTHYIRNYKTELLNAENKIKHYDELIKNYKNETILILSSGEDKKLQSITKNLDAYNELVLQQAANNKEKAYYEKLISDYEERLNNIQATGTVGVHDYAEITITGIIEAYNKLYQDVCDMTESFTASSGYQGSFTSFTTSNTSSARFFSKGNIKKALIGLFGGAFGGVVIWGVYGLVVELKRSSKKREESENEQK